MPTYTYLGPTEDYFPTLGRTLAPGDTAALEANPGDGRWSPPDAPAPEPPPAALPPAPAPLIPTDPGPADADPQHAEEATDA